MAKKKNSSIASTPEVLRPHGEDDLVGRKYYVLADQGHVRKAGRNVINLLASSLTLLLALYEHLQFNLIFASKAKKDRMPFRQATGFIRKQQTRLKGLAWDKQ